MSDKWQEILGAGKDTLLELLGPALEGAEGDIKAWGQAILQNAAEALKIGDQVVLGDLGHQIKCVAETNRIRLAKGFTWEGILEKVLIVGKFVAAIAPLF
jgi:hypothetical protein